MGSRGEETIAALSTPVGEYGIFSETDPEAIRGVIHIVEPATE